jgi:cytosine deaminase
VVASRIGVIANPITNLFLQGWGSGPSMPRGLAPARELIDAGARFAAGADNVRDPFNPLGRGDVFETAMLLVTAGHLTVEEAYAAVSTSAREVMSLPAAGATPGSLADFVAVRGSSLADVVARAPEERMVIHAGRLVAATTVQTSLAAVRPAVPTGADAER